MATRRIRSCRHTLADGRSVTIRAATERDADEIVQTFDRLSRDTRYARFMHHKTVLRPEEVRHALRPRPGRALVLLATVPAADGIDIVGGAQYLPEGGDDEQACEFAMTVTDLWQGSGLGRRLLSSLLRRARRDGYTTLRGTVLAGNAPMLALVGRLGFKIEPTTGNDGAVCASRSLLPKRPKRPKRPKQPKAPETDVTAPVPAPVPEPEPEADKG